MADENNDPKYAKRFRNIRTGKFWLAAERSNGDVYWAESDENGKPTSAGNQIPRDEYNHMLDESEMEADFNTIDATFFGGEIIHRRRPQRL